MKSAACAVPGPHCTTSKPPLTPEALAFIEAKILSSRATTLVTHGKVCEPQQRLKAGMLQDLLAGGDSGTIDHLSTR